jgi:hypothetical protein
MKERKLPDFFAHTYPRYGLAAALVDQDVLSWKEALSDTEYLLNIARAAVKSAMTRFRIHTTADLDNETTLQYRYLGTEDIQKGQGAEDGYYVMPHVMTTDRQRSNTIQAVWDMLDRLNPPVNLNRTDKLQRSLSPFAAKLNAGSSSLSDERTDVLESAFSLVASITPLKPAIQVDHKTNQAMIPDLDLEGLIIFVRLFLRMQGSETDNGLTLARNRKSNGELSSRKRPPVFDGNYPNAPRSPAFGPVGLMGAIGQWMQRADILAEEQKQARDMLDAIAGRSIYLVSYDGKLMRQEYVGHHVARLAKNHNLPKVIQSLHRIRFYNADHTKPDSNTRATFFMLASRFLQLYTKPAFKDFLAFRASYESNLSPILTEFFMSEYKIERDIVESARAYGVYLNDVAYFAAREEVAKNEERDDGGTGRDIYDAKTRVLAQLESTAMSARRPSSLFAQINVMAGRISGRDVPAEAERFMEAVQTGEVALDEAKDLVLAYMRLRKDTRGASAKDFGEASDGGVDATASDEEGMAFVE